MRISDWSSDVCSSDLRERLRTAHPAEPGGQDPLARRVARKVTPRNFGEGLVGALNDALAADVNPRPRGHLTVHHQHGAIELLEMLPRRPMRHEVRIGDQHARRVLVLAAAANRIARLDTHVLVHLTPPTPP